MPARAASRTTSSARWSRARATTSRSRCRTTTRRAPTGTTRTITAAPTSRSRAAWSGALIVEGDFDDVPEIAAAAERVLICREVRVRRLGDDRELRDAVSRDGAALPRGQRPARADDHDAAGRGAALAASSARSYQDDLLLALERHELQRHRLRRHPARRAMPEIARPLLIAPGQRADVLVQAGAPGTYELRALPTTRATRRRSGRSPAWWCGRAAADGAAGGATPAAVRGDRDSEITSRRTVTCLCDDRAGGRRRRPLAGVHVPGRRQDVRPRPRRPARARSARSRNGRSSNNHDHDDHVFHIHTNPFQVVAVNGRRRPRPRLARHGGRAAQGGSVTFRSRFLDFTGDFVLHCHMMNHEELGMMQIVEVYKD